jgi:hypothetical protein
MDGEEMVSESQGWQGQGEDLLELGRRWPITMKVWLGALCLCGEVVAVFG